MLTDLECKTAEPGEKDRKLFDGGGLYLMVKKSGYKSWRLKYRFAGKEKQLTIGPYPLVKITMARAERDQAKLLLLAGKDPSAEKRRRNSALIPDSDPKKSFRVAGMRWHALQAKRWKPRHAQKVLESLEREVFPIIGSRALEELKPSDIKPILQQMQDRGSIDQAHRVLNRIYRIFELAVVDELAETNPAASLRVILQPISKRKYPAILKLQQAQKALIKFEAEPHQPSVKLASRFLALTAARPGPVRFAEHAEFQDLETANPVWIIPAAKMKLEREQSEQDSFEFVIPLASQTVELIKVAMHFASGSTYLFPSIYRSHKPVAENALSTAYRRCPSFSGRHVPHGWRSTFSTVMNERAADLDRPGDRAIIDLMLGHKPDGVEATYNRAAYMRRRMLLAQEWADMLLTGLSGPEQLLKGLRN